MAGNGAPALSSASSPVRPAGRAASGIDSLNRGARLRAGGRARRVSLSNHRLRLIVMRLRGCLSAIAPQQAEVLVLRTGIGLRRSYRPDQIARILRVTLPREAQIERSGVSALQSAARDGSCTGARGATTGGALFVAGTELPSWAHPISAARVGTGSASLGGLHSAQYRRHRARHAISGATTGPPAVIIPPRHGRVDWVFGVFVISVLAVAGWLIVSDLRSRTGKRSGHG
jgi:hypothetical protein